MPLGATEGRLGRAKFCSRKELAKLLRDQNPLPRVPDRVEPLGPGVALGKLHFEAMKLCVGALENESSQWARSRENQQTSRAKPGRTGPSSHAASFHGQNPTAPDGAVASG